MSLSTARTILLKPLGYEPGMIMVAITTILVSQYATRSDIIAANRLLK